MRCRIARFVVIASLVTAGYAPVFGHAVPLGAEEIVRGSKYVVVATVIDATPVRRGASGLIVTRYRLAVEDALRGHPPGELAVEVVGGTIGDETQDSCMSVKLDPGGRYVLFVNDPDNPGFGTFTGAQQGVFAEVKAGGTSTVRSASGAFVNVIAGHEATFAEFVDHLRAFINGVEAAPAAAPRPPVIHDPPLPSKRVAHGDGEATLDRTPVVPQAPPESRGPEPVAGQPVVHRDASFAQEAPASPRRDHDGYSYSRTPGRYIVWNQLPSWLTPWFPHDQLMMSRWNTYGDIHRVSASPTGTWQWGDNIYDMTGFPSNADMLDEFGRVWGGNELAVCFSRWFGSGPIVESDISVNPNFGWTLELEPATRGSAPEWGYDQTLLHELGHSWGLAHPFEVQNVWWDSVMNYSPKNFRFPYLAADDTNAIRAAYPGIGIHDGFISMYRTQDDPNSTSAAYVGVFPTSSSARQGDSMAFAEPFKLENIGTDGLVNPQVGVYLTPYRTLWDGWEYLATLSYGLTVPVFSTFTLSTGNFTVPWNTPPGAYYVALQYADAADTLTYNNSAWSPEEWGRFTITSYPWNIYPASFWQYQAARTGFLGEYTFYMQGAVGDRFDFSTCPSDGGYANFDTVLTLYDLFLTQVDYSDDACGLQSRISYYVPWTGQYHISLKGWQGAWGSFTLQYRSRSWTSGSLWLTAIAKPATGSVGLTWGGDTGPYDVQRSTTANFANPVALSTGTYGTVLDDPVLTNGQIYFYRAR